MIVPGYWTWRELSSPPARIRSTRPKRKSLSSFISLAPPQQVNLEENEKLKIQMAIPKIPDPKTPWLSPGSVSDHDEPTDLAEFMLPNVAVALQGGAGPSGQPQLAVQATEQLMQNSGGGAGPGPSSMQRFSGSGEDRRSSGTVS